MTLLVHVIQVLQGPPLAVRRNEIELKLVRCHVIQYVVFLCYRREEVSGEAQRVLRAFSTKSSEKEGPKPMPSFPDMVAYVQEKVRLCAFLSLPLGQ